MRRLGLACNELAVLAPLILAEIFPPYEVLVRFGRWDEILAEPDHPEFMVFTRVSPCGPRHCVCGKGRRQVRAHRTYGLPGGQQAGAGGGNLWQQPVPSSARDCDSDASRPLCRRGTGLPR